MHIGLVVILWLTAAALMAFVITRTIRIGDRQQPTDPEDYARRSQYPAKRAADELAQRRPR